MPTSVEDLLRDAGAQWRASIDAMPQRSAAAPWWRRRWVIFAATAACLAALIVPIYRSAELAPIRGQLGSGAGADCAAPQLSIAGVAPHAVPTLHPGEEITVKGYAYVSGCHEYQHDPASTPITVTIALKGRDDQRDLKTVRSIGSAGRFTTKVRVPQDFAPGPATLHAGPHWPHSTVQVTIAERGAS